MKTKLIILCSLFIISCNKERQPKLLDDITVISAKKIEFKVLDSKHLNMDTFWKPFEKYWTNFTHEDYNRIKPLVLEQNIPTLQRHISEGNMSYKELTLFYLYRIKKYDRLNDLSLNSVISLNPNVVEAAKEKDLELRNRKSKHAIFGMPLLLKDNINVSGMPTTVGAIALISNKTQDAFITKQLKHNGALILGKANLSEWAYFFCGQCPSGYSAVGGQTLNPYGRKVLDTGGSSSGSAVATAANFAAGSIGSETAGSILSPASQNSGVGLKPTIGALSRTGIVPISSTLDTPGPITKNVIDAAIIFDAMKGVDTEDTLSFKIEAFSYSKDILIKQAKELLMGSRFGVFKKLLSDTLYFNAVDKLKINGALIVEIEAIDVSLNGLLTLLNIDMRNDLPKYLKNADRSLSIKSVRDVIVFNKKDSVLSMPYGQSLFYGIVNDTTTEADFKTIKDALKIKGKDFFDVHIKAHNLDAILSINNYHAPEAAVAIYPAITIPMGYDTDGKPEGLTFITSKTEVDLLKWGYAYERISEERKSPINYN
jgi:amidase